MRLVEDWPERQAAASTLRCLTVLGRATRSHAPRSAPYVSPPLRRCSARRLFSWGPTAAGLLRSHPFLAADDKPSPIDFKTWLTELPPPLTFSAAPRSVRPSPRSGSFASSWMPPCSAFWRAFLILCRVSGKFSEQVHSSLKNYPGAAARRRVTLVLRHIGLLGEKFVRQDRE